MSRRLAGCAFARHVQCNSNNNNYSSGFLFNSFFSSFLLDKSNGNSFQSLGVFWFCFITGQQEPLGIPIEKQNSFLFLLFLFFCVCQNMRRRI